MDTTRARQRVDELRHQESVIDPGELDEVFDALEPVDCDSLLGRWKGTPFNTGHFGVKQLGVIGWYGKTFNSRLDVEPVVCTADDGTLYANTEVTGGAGASLWMVEFRGVVSATMVYDALPVLDHFRKVDDSTVMGVMNGKEMVFDNGHHLYFLLDRT
jgi:hypothetical protein